ncbi:MAG TPA: HK97 gp10 family phage protein [Chloroflexota bacterium]|nr:HK97 gp10 family phage protein [Chloroflexota bacterium]
MSVQLGPEWEAFLRRLQTTPEQMERDMRQTLQASLLLVEASARSYAPQDTRRLAGSISQRITGTYPSLVGEVGPGVRYGLFVEFGRRAGARMPPVNALIGWVTRHWNPAFIGPLRQGELRPRRAAGPGVSQAAIRSRAFALARAIQRRGIPARPFMGPAYESNRARIEAGFARIGLRVVAYLAGNPIP